MGSYLTKCLPIWSENQLDEDNFKIEKEETTIPLSQAKQTLIPKTTLESVRVKETSVLEEELDFDSWNSKPSPKPQTQPASHSPEVIPKRDSLPSQKIVESSKPIFQSSSIPLKSQTSSLSPSSDDHFDHWDLENPKIEEKSSKIDEKIPKKIEEKIPKKIEEKIEEEKKEDFFADLTPEIKISKKILISESPKSFQNSQNLSKNFSQNRTNESSPSRLAQIGINDPFVSSLGEGGGWDADLPIEENEENVEEEKPNSNKKVKSLKSSMAVSTKETLGAVKVDSKLFEEF